MGILTDMMKAKALQGQAPQAGPMGPPAGPMAPQAGQPGIPPESKLKELSERLKGLSQKLDTGLSEAEQPDSKKLKSIPESSAGRITMMETAKTSIPKIRDMVFDQDGSINWGNVATSDIPLLPGSAPLPKSKGQELSNEWEKGIQAITRIETGAAMPAEEIDNTRKRFQINFWDSEDTAINKYLAYKMFINGYLDVVKTGRGKVGTFNDTKMDAYQSRLQNEMQTYREDWIQRAQEANPSIPPEQLRKEWNKKLIFDEDFVRKMAGKLRGKDEVQETK